MSALRFVVPMPENRANARGHWAKKYRTQKAYFATLDTMQAAGLLPAPPRKPFDRATVSSHMMLGARMDQDNSVARHKDVLDWLQTRGYIANDRNVVWDTFPTQAISRAESCIVLTLTPL